MLRPLRRMAGEEERRKGEGGEKVEVKAALEKATGPPSALEDGQWSGHTKLLSQSSAISLLLVEASADSQSQAAMQRSPSTVDRWLFCFGPSGIAAPRRQEHAIQLSPSPSPRPNRSYQDGRRPISAVMPVSTTAAPEVVRRGAGLTVAAVAAISVVSAVSDPATPRPGCYHTNTSTTRC